MFHDRLKHIEMKYHFIRDLVQRGTLKLQYICTDEQIADILTKPLTSTKFVYFRDKLGITENTSRREAVLIFPKQHREPFSWRMEAPSQLPGT